MITPCLDILGSGSKYWPVKRVIKAVPRDVGLGMFHDEFGKKTIPNLLKYIEAGFTLFRIQLHYDKAHSLIPMENLQKFAVLYEAIARDHPHIQVWLSHSTEYDSRDLKQIGNRFDALREFAPHCFALNNPSGKGSIDSGNLELHYPDKRDGADSISFDGQDSSEVDALPYMQTLCSKPESILCFSWGGLFNLNDGKQPADPTQRTAAPSEKYLREYVRLAQNPGTMPNFQVSGLKQKEIKKPLLYKPMSRGTGDDREWKPVFISPSKAQRLTILTYNGRQVGTLGYYGTFTGGLYRHYSSRGSNLWGYEMCDEAQGLSGYSWVWFVDEKSKIAYGPVQPVYRFGYPRAV